MTKDVYIIAAVRTPIGGFMGGLSTISATELGSIAIKGISIKKLLKIELNKFKNK